MSDDDASCAGKTVRDLDFSGAHLHSPNFERVRITDGWFLNTDISGFIGGLRINDVEIAPLVSAELDRRFPDRVKLRATDPEGLADAWTMIEGVWYKTVERARRLPEELWYERVAGEWSFVETLRHLIFATDGWLLRMVLGDPRPYHPWGFAPSFVSDLTVLGIDPVAQPKLDDVLDVRRERMERVRRMIETSTAQELSRRCSPPDEIGHPADEQTVLRCLHVILDEEWEHNRYANRDLGVLESRL
jgi:hypothetical protein